MNSKPIRLLYLVFERGQFNPLYEPFQRLLRSILEALPDSRIVEQLHQWLRDLSRKSKADVSSCIARMNACITSEALKPRGIEAYPCPCRVHECLAWWRDYSGIEADMGFVVPQLAPRNMQES
jgi:hypothetical protein